MPHSGQPLRIDADAASTDANLPAFIAAPTDAPAYHGFPLLRGSERDGFIFGTITEPNGDKPAEWGDAYVVAPNGTRAGIVWQVGDGKPYVVCEPSVGRWGVYGFHFPKPITSEADLFFNLHSTLPALKEYFEAACRAFPEFSSGVPPIREA